ncbi:MAG: hypothetical protein CSB48_10280 [Proteobacteria bacterium]|nr:MAG: hypothetical protein CSB48_10280 [Pseudomonadota bacterium]
MMIKEGMMVTLRQKTDCPIVDYSSDFEITGIYPRHFDAVLANHLSGRKINDEFSFEFSSPLFEFQQFKVIKIRRKNLKSDKPLKEGMLFITNAIIGGCDTIGRVISFDEDFVSLDCNYPYYKGARQIVSNHILDIKVPSDEELLQLAGPSPLMRLTSTSNT